VEREELVIFETPDVIKVIQRGRELSGRSGGVGGHQNAVIFGHDGSAITAIFWKSDASVLSQDNRI
jgi:hypothetical protein